MDTDPTKINIELDPTKQRMIGTAIHGNTPFDVPFISEIAPNLWQGGCQNGLVLPDFINHIVSLYQWEEYDIRHPIDSRLIVCMYDSLDQSHEQIDSIARWVNDRRSEGIVLVHCQAGLNRSSLVVARALMLSRELEGWEAIKLIREKRSPACLCNPAFERYIRQEA